MKRLVRASRAGDRGAVAVEAALLLPIMITLVFGIIEFSLVLKDKQGITAGVQAGARQAATATSQSDTNFATDVATAVQSAMTNVTKKTWNGTTGTQLWVYRSTPSGVPAIANTGTATVPLGGSTPASASAFSAGSCLQNACVMFGWNGSSFVWIPVGANPLGGTFTAAEEWPLSSVGTCAGQGTSCTEDSVGVYVSTPHDYLTGLFGASVNLSSHTALSFEPVASGLS